VAICRRPGELSLLESTDNAVSTFKVFFVRRSSTASSSSKFTSVKPSDSSPVQGALTAEGGIISTDVSSAVNDDEHVNIVELLSSEQLQSFCVTDRRGILLVRDGAVLKLVQYVSEVDSLTDVKLSQMMKVLPEMN